MKTFLLCTVVCFLFLGGRQEVEHESSNVKILSIDYIGKNGMNILFKDKRIVSHRFRGLDSFIVHSDTMYIYYHEEYTTYRFYVEKEVNKVDTNYIDTSAILILNIIKSDSLELVLYPLNTEAFGYFKPYELSPYTSENRKYNLLVNGRKIAEYISEKKDPRKNIYFRSPQFYLDTINFDTIYISTNLDGMFGSKTYDLRLTKDGQFFIYKTGKPHSKKRKSKKSTYNYSYTGQLSELRMDTIRQLLDKSGLFKFKSYQRLFGSDMAEVNLRISCKLRKVNLNQYIDAYLNISMPFLNELICNIHAKGYTKKEAKICIPTSYREDLRKACSK